MAEEENGEEKKQQKKQQQQQQQQKKKKKKKKKKKDAKEKLCVTPRNHATFHVQMATYSAKERSEANPAIKQRSNLESVSSITLITSPNGSLGAVSVCMDAH